MQNNNYLRADKICHNCCTIYYVIQWFVFKIFTDMIYLFIRYQKRFMLYDTVTKGLILYTGGKQKKICSRKDVIFAGKLESFS